MSNPLSFVLWPLAVWLSAAAAAVAQPASRPQAPAGNMRNAFQLCDARTFVAMGLARSYFTGGRQKEPVRSLVKNDPWGRETAETLFRLADAGTLQHHAEFAADVLVQCAVANVVQVGAPKNQVRLCLARTDVGFYLHADRTAGLVRQEAISRTAARLKPREVYPTALVNAVAEVVYRPEKIPDLRALTSRMLWSCIQARPQGAASAASR
jgi:hypothetical protein